MATSIRAGAGAGAGATTGQTAAPTALISETEYNEIFNCKTLQPFIRTIVARLPYRGITNSKFFICKLGGVRFFTKLSFYAKTELDYYNIQTKDTEHPVDAELSIMEIFRDEFLRTRATPCIVELLYARKCKSLRSLIPVADYCAELLTARADTIEKATLRDFCTIRAAIAAGTMYPQCAWVVMEHMDLTLQQYVSATVFTAPALAVFKSLLFGVIYALFIIHSKYPQFRHYDLHTDNVMLTVDVSAASAAATPQYIEYHCRAAGLGTYYIPYYGITPKIIDFGMSALPERGIVSRNTKSVLHITYAIESDVTTLLWHINRAVAQSPAGDKFRLLRALMEQLDPSMSWAQTSYDALLTAQPPSLEEMMKNDIWQEYRALPPGATVVAKYTYPPPVSK